MVKLKYLMFSGPKFCLKFDFIMKNLLSEEFIVKYFRAGTINQMYVAYCLYSFGDRLTSV